MKDRLLFILKALLSVFAIIYVFRKVNLRDVTSLLDSANLLYIVFAFLAFTLSKLASASRTLLILNTYNVPISVWGNIKLYWTGMAYNMFLPGGIGGDIYKTFIINNKYKSGIRISAGALLMDRFSGMSVLVALALTFIPFTSLGDRWGLLSMAGVIITLAGFVTVSIIVMPRLKLIVGFLIGWSFVVQALQLLSVNFILRSLNVNSGYLEYSFIFLVSSIATMLPLSIGGFGLRELVFLSVSSFFFLDQKIAVTTSFTFYLITLSVSLFGIITAMELKGRGGMRGEVIIDSDTN